MKHSCMVTGLVEQKCDYNVIIKRKKRGLI